MTCEPRLSLIVCTLGRQAELERALTSFERQTMPDFEIILVDQNPPGFLDTIMSRFSARLALRRIETPRGLSRGRNIALASVRAGLVGFPDDDCWYTRDVCERVVAYFAERPELDFLTGRTIDPQGRECNGEFAAKPGRVFKRDAFTTGNTNTFFVKRETARAAGGFDETLGPGAPDGPKSGEDIDFLLRCIGSGAHVHYDPAFTIFHDAVDVEKTEKTSRRIKDYSVGFGRLIRNHDFGYRYLAYRTARSFARAGLYAATGDFWNARMRLAWASGTVRGFLTGQARQ